MHLTPTWQAQPEGSRSDETDGPSFPSARVRHKELRNRAIGSGAGSYPLASWARRLASDSSAPLHESVGFRATSGTGEPALEEQVKLPAAA